MAETHISGVEAIDHAVDQAADIRELARLLGRRVLEERTRIVGDLAAMPSAGRLMEAVRVRAAAPTLATWPAGGRELDRDLLADIRRLHASPDLAVLAMLQGLCSGGGALELVFGDTWDAVVLQRGDPYPIPPGPRLRVSRRMPNPRETVRTVGPLAGVTDYELHEGSLWPTVLEFRHKARLDDALWQWSDEQDAQLPVVGAVYPLAVTDYALPVDEVTDTKWFGAWPKEGRWSEEIVVDALQRIHDAGGTLAILPELGVPTPEALADAVARGAEAGSTPALVVAGSAHVRVVQDDGSVHRSNEAVVYLNGSELLRHRKVHPYQTNERLVLGSVGPEKRSEWLTSPGALHIAMGHRGRLAVMICADSLDPYLIGQLVEAQVNVVVIPAFTFEDAGFGGLAALTNLNQALVAIVNGAPTPFALRCLLPDARNDVISWSPDGERPTSIVFDPAAATDDAVRPV